PVRAYPVLAQVSLSYSEPKGAFPRVTLPSAAAVLLRPLDLHVLGLPPAFALSQDQTLKLDEIFIPADHLCACQALGRCQFAEVHPMIFRSAVYLKRVPPKSLPKPPSAKNCFPQEGDPQGPRRPRFSFFRFTFQTARGPWRTPPSGRPESRRSPCIRELSDAVSLFQ